MTKPHQQRVISERAELADRLEKLAVFIGSASFEQMVPNEGERGLLVIQKGIMQTYADILDARISVFGNHAED